MLLLQKKDGDFRRKIKSQNEKISKLKLDEHSLADERKLFRSMEEKNLQNKSNKEDELWKMRQSVYSSVAEHCDGILDVMKNYSLINMKEFIEAKLDRRECFNKDCNPFARAAAETSEKTGSGRKKLLTDEISRLSLSIEKLKEREAGVLNAQSRRAELKYEPVNGDEYTSLQNELKDLRNDILTITNEISTLERRNSTVAMDVDVCLNIGSKNKRSDQLEDGCQSPCSTHSTDSVVSTSAFNQYRENAEQQTIKGHRLEQENRQGKFKHKMFLEKSLTQEHKTQESITPKVASKSQTFVFKPPKYFKQSQPK
ncbi:spindle pole body component 110 isoform X2 [Nilaparvata lugens]|nr:spindle pole body component 110 isoform X2 [Nilaparvata lugens]XP_039283191.1 spindle pole body component 110 isoform X2 [Nilaparvata lugens]XP_039283192.1 spindle pole body component 110 isoform X2 [Nilaparvata lugens]XP_039283193.1 spindle pole body component 110 isoform X2 [Nilaparvata lugens]